MKLLYRGSVKALYERDDQELGFEFSDRYSIFDWGEMPQHIPGKGDALLQMAASFFELLQTEGFARDFMGEDAELLNKYYRSVPTHYLGTDETQLRVKKVQVPNRGDIDSFYQDRPTDALIPLEVVFRSGVPAGSSLLSKVKRSPWKEQYAHLGQLNEWDRFDSPIIEYYTKLEEVDRPLTQSDACQLAGMSPREEELLRALTRWCARCVGSVFDKLGLELWDGKFEFAFGLEQDGVRVPYLVDSIGPDELRVCLGTSQLSKEFLRQQYRGSKWLDQLELAKKEASESGESWKSVFLRHSCQGPEALQDHVIELVSRMYTLMAKEIENIRISQTSSPQWGKFKDEFANFKS